MATVARAVSLNLSRMHQPRNSVSLSTFPPPRGRQKCCSLRPVMRTALILPRQCVPATGFSHDFLKIAAVPDCFFQFLRQLLRHVDRKSMITLAAVQRIAGMSLA